MKYTISLGNLSDGFTFIGVFDSQADAIVYAEEFHHGEQWEIISISVVA